MFIAFRETELDFETVSKKTPPTQVRHFQETYMISDNTISVVDYCHCGYYEA